MIKPEMRFKQFTLQIFLALILLLSAIYLYMDSSSNVTANDIAKVAGINKSNSSKINRSNVPTNGSFKFGMFSDEPFVGKDEKKIDAKLNIVGWFVHWNESMHSNKLKNACSFGYVPEITWETWVRAKGVDGNSNILNEIVDGRYDKKINDDIDSISKSCTDKTVLIRLNHEMETAPNEPNRYYPWQGNPEMYIKAWKHIVNISRKKNKNIKYIWSPNRGNMYTSLYYPGEKNVDYVGLTLNHHGEVEHEFTTFQSFYEPNKTVIESFNKPIIISETAFTDSDNPADKAAWIDSMFSYVQSNKKITAVVWFNSVKAMRYDTSPESIQAFKDNLKQINTGGK